MELNETPTDYSSTPSSQEDDLAHRIRLFKAELDKRAVSTEKYELKPGDILSWAKETYSAKNDV